MMRWFRSLRFAIPVLLALVITLISLWSLRSNAQRWEHETERTIMAENNRVMTQLQPVLEYAASKGDESWMREAVASLGADPNLTLAVLVDADDRIVAATRLALLGRPASAVFPGDSSQRSVAYHRRAENAVASMVGGIALTADGRQAVGAYPVRMAGSKNAVRSTRTGVLYVEIDLGPAKANARAAVRRQVIGSSAVLALIVLALGVFLHVRVTARIRALMATTARIASGDLEARTSVTGGDEIGQLAAALDEMAAQRQRSNEERERLESEIRQAQKMEAVGQLASGVAHDFNNLLMGINGCAEIALRRSDAASSARLYLDEIKNTTMSGVAITRQLLAFSRRRNHELRGQAVDDIIASTEPMLRRLLGEGIDLEIDLKASPKQVRCGDGYIEQLVMNLVVNARDAMPDGGTIVVTTDIVEIDAARARGLGDIAPGEYLAMSVKDTGTGMDDETREHIFEPFFTTKEPGKGTGLGLATVYGIVRQCHGHTQLGSEVGVGTTFTVYLPTAEAPVNTAGDESLKGRRGTETVLVVEDQRLVRMTIRDYLERWGYRVLEAGDSDQGLQIGRKHIREIALLITDIVLPGITGSELAHRLVTKNPELPVIFMSAHPRGLLVEERRLPASATLLQKPFSEMELLSRIRDVLGADDSSRGERTSAEQAETAGAAEPAAKGPAPAASPPRSGDGVACNGRYSRKTVLLIEDNDIARMATRELLEDEGYEILEAATGAEALALFKRHDTIELILTDIGLPDMDGRDVVSDIRSSEPDIYTIYISGSGDTEANRNTPGEAPRTVYLEKPVDFAHLIRTIESLLG